MKVLTLVIPVYNTEKYVKRCLDSILIEDVLEDIEVITVNDGSKDGSVEILRRYEKMYPNSVVVIDKENGGHGSTVNAGLEKATGKYFRVIDSDDWVNSHDFVTFVNKLKNEDADLVVTNYRKELIYSGESEYLEYTDLEDDVLYDFDEIDLGILKGEYFVMATSTYKTELLRRAKLKLFEKTFYVDMQYNIIPIPELKTFKFLDLDIYRYFIGRPGQSMDLANFVRNRAQHEKVMKFLVEFYCERKETLSKNKNEYISLILYYMLTTNYYIYCVYCKKGNSEIHKEIMSFDKYLKEKDNELYKRLYAVGQVKYNRKTNFFFTRFCPNFFSKWINFIGKVLRG